MTEFSPQTREILHSARAEAQLLEADYIGSEHLFLALLQGNEDNPVAPILQSLGMSLRKARDATREMSTRGDTFAGFTPEAKRAIHLAIDETRQQQQQYVAPEHLLLALTIQAENSALDLLHCLGINLEELRTQIRLALLYENIPR